MDSNKQLEITWPLVLKIWWSYFWRSVIWGCLCGLILGSIGGLVVGLTGIGNATIVGAILGYVAGIIASIWCLKTILTKKFKKHHLVVLTTE